MQDQDQEQEDELPATTTFGKAVRSERKRLGLTQKQLADKLGTSQQNAGGWETAKSFPGHDLFEKLVDLFGRDSPVASMPPRTPNTEIQLVPAAKQMQPTTAEVRDEYGERARIQFEREWRKGARLDTSVLADELPAELKPNLQRIVENPHLFGTYQYKADYLSDKLCLEMKKVTGNRLEYTARLGMQQMVLFKTILEQANPPKERTGTYVLALVIDDLGRTNGISRLSFEAAMLGIIIGFYNNQSAVAKSIIQLEDGGYDTDLFNEPADDF